MTDDTLIVFIDCGDTIIDESTEVRDDRGIVQKADVIPGADKAIKAIKEAGYPIVMVADGEALSFFNMMHDHGLYDCFDAMIYSENVKARKPDPRMFKAAWGAVNASPEDAWRTVMIGNNLARDVKGANALGIHSIFLDWSPRYPKVAADASEQPNSTIHTPSELLPLLNQLQQQLLASSR
ncbi:HAD family hydrolase [Aureibacillus halotolerans]|uniref:Putative hydrolase of the HAD superfamily n=1 Tax=Aureibacillus halotolerans TaxID=1508390 RepID=A0A4R6TS59_9BACI|nr:HAD family hydrolase [Aureibacillus halotolerans]TDQ36440.1 putative hydrolase of the HAD superfamily [Aureibacillus halotolerans]